MEQPRNAATAGSGSATVSLNSTNPTSQLLVGVNPGVSLPAGAVVTAIKVRITGFFTVIGGGSAEAEVFEIWPWDGSGGGSAPSTSRNQAGTFSKSDGTGVITLTTSIDTETRGANNWK